MRCLEGNAPYDREDAELEGESEADVDSRSGKDRPASSFDLDAPRNLADPHPTADLKSDDQDIVDGVEHSIDKSEDEAKLTSRESYALYYTSDAVDGPVSPNSILISKSQCWKAGSSSGVSSGPSKTFDAAVQERPARAGRKRGATALGDSSSMSLAKRLASLHLRQKRRNGQGSV
jgi:hypothetical protein